MSEQVRVSAKTLGELVLPGFCPMCFWIKLRLNHRLPFQIFPGIFTSIDAYTKNIIHAFFDLYGKFPTWLNSLGELSGYCKPPHYSTFNIVDTESNVLLTGSPDGVFIRADGSHLIVDYKTAKYTSRQDELMPMYEVQLNAYAAIGERKGLSPVSGLALVYMEPVTHAKAVINTVNHRDDGFAMGFTTHIQSVDLSPDTIPPLYRNRRGACCH